MVVLCPSCGLVTTIGFHAARVGGAMIALAIACVPVLAAIPLKSLWTTVLLMVIVLGSLGAVAAVIGCAYGFPDASGAGQSRDGAQ